MTSDLNRVASSFALTFLEREKSEGTLAFLGKELRTLFPNGSQFVSGPNKAPFRAAFAAAYEANGGRKENVPSYWQRLVYQFAWPGLNGTYCSGKLYGLGPDGITPVVVERRLPTPVKPEQVPVPVASPARPSSPLLSKVPLLTVASLVDKIEMPARIVCIAKSGSGKTVIVKSLLQSLGAHRTIVMTGSSVEQWADIGETHKWDPNLLDRFVDQQKKSTDRPRPYLMFVLDDIGAEKDAKSNSTLDSLFQLGRHDDMGVIVLSQQANLLLTPTRRNNTSVILWSKVDLDQQKHVLAMTALPVPLAQFKLWMYNEIGPNHDFAFACYIEKLNPSLYKVRAVLGESVENEDDDDGEWDGLSQQFAAASVADLPVAVAGTPERESKAWGAFKQGGSNQKPKEDKYFTLKPTIQPLVEMLEAHLDKDKVLIWEPCFGEGGIANPLTDCGFKVISSDLYTMPEKTSFVEFKDKDGKTYEACPVPDGVTHIVTNPPFSLKNQFFKRIFELNLPTFLLLPVDLLGTKRDLALLKEHGFNLFLLPGAAASSTFFNKDENRNVSVGTCAWFGLNMAASGAIEFL